MKWQNVIGPCVMLNYHQFWPRLGTNLEASLLAFKSSISALSRVGDQTKNQHKNKEEKRRERRKKEEKKAKKCWKNSVLQEFQISKG